MSFILRALARRAAQTATAAVALHGRQTVPQRAQGVCRMWAAGAQGWGGFSTESTSGASGAEPKRPSPPVGLVKDDGNALNELYYLMKMGHGLPPIEEVVSFDTEGEEREQRRQTEIQKQEEIARSRVPVVDKMGRAYGTGKRKEAIARVWLTPGTGDIRVNQRIFGAYFPSIDLRQQVIMPFLETNTLGHFNVHCHVQGGGPSGQAQARKRSSLLHAMQQIAAAMRAVRHGISKALQAYNPDLRPPLRSAGLLTRDSRVVERKKPGRKKARKSFQWVKR